MTAAQALYALGILVIVVGLAHFGPGLTSARAEPARERPDDQVVYVMHPDTWWGRWFGPSKIGISNDPERRRRTFETGHYHGLRIHAIYYVRNASRVEARAHARLRRYHRRGEWFNRSPRVAARAVRLVIRKPRPGVVPWIRRWRIRAGL